MSPTSRYSQTADEPSDSSPTGTGPRGFASRSTSSRDLRERIVADVNRIPWERAPFIFEGVIPKLREAMAPADVVMSDVGSHKMAIAQNFPTYAPNTCIISNGLASMGIAVPGGLAAELAVDADVVAATGDGGFQMNAAESFGIDGYRPELRTELREVLDAAVGGDMSLVEIQVA